MPKGNPGIPKPLVICDNCQESMSSSNFSRHRATCEERDKYCPVCSKFFRARACNKSVIFCSHSCYMIQRNRDDPELSRRAAQKAGQVIAEKYRGTGTKSYIKEGGRHQHRVVAEEKLGRPLEEGEIVHHIDGNKFNNDPDNLQVMTQSEHARIHFQGKK